MSFGERIEEALGYSTSVYDCSGAILEGKNEKFVSTEDVIITDGRTYIKSGSFIICVGEALSPDAVRLVRYFSESELKKAYNRECSELEYIIKSKSINYSASKRYAGKRVFYIKSEAEMADLLKIIYEGTFYDIYDDGEGIYLSMLFEDDEEEANSVINEISEQTGEEIIIGSSKEINEGYTVLKAAEHAKQSAELAEVLSFKSGYYPIDRMVFYDIIKKADASDIESYLEVFSRTVLSIINDRELIETAEEFMKCSLNISEASRRLYLHRNTLLYRIEKIKNLTGLDIKKFDDAMAFKTILSICRLNV